MPERVFQQLPCAPRDADGLPIGSACDADCRAPVRSHAHCSVCHSTFRTVTDFDRHRVGGRCLDLASIGLIESDGLWATPEGIAASERLAANARDRNAQSEDP